MKNKYWGKKVFIFVKINNKFQGENNSIKSGHRNTRSDWTFSTISFIFFFSFFRRKNAKSILCRYINTNWRFIDFGLSVVLSFVCCLNWLCLFVGRGSHLQRTAVGSVVRLRDWSCVCYGVQNCTALTHTRTHIPNNHKTEFIRFSFVFFFVWFGFLSMDDDDVIACVAR